jgi:hypothetical protein
MTDDQKTPDETDVSNPNQKGGGAKDVATKENAEHQDSDDQPANPEDPEEAQSPT